MLSQPKSAQDLEVASKTTPNSIVLGGQTNPHSSRVIPLESRPADVSKVLVVAAVAPRIENNCHQSRKTSVIGGPQVPLADKRPLLLRWAHREATTHPHLSVGPLVSLREPLVLLTARINGPKGLNSSRLLLRPMKVVVGVGSVARGGAADHPRQVRPKKKHQIGEARCVPHQSRAVVLHVSHVSPIL